jgi:hypothetical protein
MLCIAHQRFPNAVQRDSGARLIRDRHELRMRKDPGSAAHHFMLRCARDTTAKCGGLSP